MCVIVYVCLSVCVLVYIGLCISVCKSMCLCYYICCNAHKVNINMKTYFIHGGLLSYAIGIELEIKDVMNLDTINIRSRLVVSGIAISIEKLNLNIS